MQARRCTIRTYLLENKEENKAESKAREESERKEKVAVRHAKIKNTRKRKKNNSQE